ncbi:MAG: glycosyltransferase family 2 protein, partial [Deltaproteobacteria bacterium]|nr:glycosyltransferase family 2 protein [Deltaproteobacteria bacterium]
QYRAADIPLLTAPILSGMAEIVIGARPIEEIEHFSRTKKLLQRFGSFVVRVLSHARVPDAPSGFRAFSREAALRLNVFSEYTYTLETIIQAGRKNMAIISVPIGVNEVMRPSRLISSIPSYLVKSAMTLVRIFAVYRPFVFFFGAGLFFSGLGLLLGLRFMFFYLMGEGQGHVQSLILTAILLGMGFQTILAAFLADLLAVNRKLLEEVQYRLRRGRDDR